MKIVEGMSYDCERALYESCNLLVKGCSFTGAADGESALKESSNITATDCYFNLRYPFWHTKNIKIENCELTTACRAPIWYCEGAEIKDTKIDGTKAVRESESITLDRCRIVSDEFGWDTRGFKINDSYIEGFYIFSRAKNIIAKGLEMKGKYSFQYIENADFDNCVFDTKDAFWHAKNVTVKNSVVKGEYLGWYSENLTLINCVITGTQPLCYCRGLTLINCKMHECDLAFEKSYVNAEITTPVISIKNVYSGKITVPCVSEIICDRDEYQGVIEIKEQALV